MSAAVLTITLTIAALVAVVGLAFLICVGLTYTLLSSARAAALGYVG